MKFLYILLVWLIFGVITVVFEVKYNRQRISIVEIFMVIGLGLLGFIVSILDHYNRWDDIEENIRTFFTRDFWHKDRFNNNEDDS